MTLGEHQEAFSRDVATLLLEAFKKGYGVRFGEAQRTPEQQALYVKTGRSKTLNSLHIKKCAIDLHFTKNGTLCYPKELGEFWEGLNPINEWGGNWKSFKDEPHFQRTV
jgi:hypothetical protein